MHGHDIRVLQDLLGDAGYDVVVDGEFGGRTFKAVEAFEGAHQRPVDGVMDADDITTRSGAAAASGRRRPAAAAPAVNNGPQATVGPDGLAVAPAGAPPQVQQIIAAGNQIASKPYKYGGGHGKWIDSGYDCSGSVSFALHGAGLLDEAMPSGSFTSWGDAGPGQWVTIYANGGHMYMVVAGLRFDTSGAQQPQHALADRAALVGGLHRPPPARPLSLHRTSPAFVRACGRAGVHRQGVMDGGRIAPPRSPSFTPSQRPGTARRRHGVDRAVVSRPPHSEAALVERARRGDAAAYEALVRAHQDIAFRTACLFAGSAADAEEAAQEAFVKAWRALPRFRAGAPFRPWLLAIVGNEARNRRRAAGRRAGLALRARRRSAPRGTRLRLPRPRSSPAASAASCSRRSSALDERDRAVIACRYLLDLSERETAEALGCRPRHGEVAAVARARAHARGARARRGGGGGGAMTDLEQRLALLRDEVAWPPTPDLADRGGRARRRPSRGRRGAGAGAAVVAARRPASARAASALVAALVVAVTLAAAPGVRARIADWLGIGAVRIERVERLPGRGPAADLGLGTRTTLAPPGATAARARPDDRARSAPPDAVYVDRAQAAARRSSTSRGRGCPRRRARRRRAAHDAARRRPALVKKLLGAGHDGRERRRRRRRSACSCPATPTS